MPQTALVALVFSILTGSVLGIIGYGLLMAVIGALIDETLVEKANKFVNASFKPSFVSLSCFRY